ncbi:hypothetical protein Ciccas_004086 [Cichlidogyrus casuarinus]|uniref:Uncharacterized protein n=1 Tax=Cichlidogyrus casuarinus TaxID=1844966 RepID=A0ABD2QCM3_9PLAT
MPDMAMKKSKRSLKYSKYGVKSTNKDELLQIESGIYLSPVRIGKQTFNESSTNVKQSRTQSKKIGRRKDLLKQRHKEHEDPETMLDLTSLETDSQSESRNTSRILAKPPSGKNFFMEQKKKKMNEEHLVGLIEKHPTHQDDEDDEITNCSASFDSGEELQEEEEQDQQMKDSESNNLKKEYDKIILISVKRNGSGSEGKHLVSLRYLNSAPDSPEEMIVNLDEVPESVRFLIKALTQPSKFEIKSENFVVDGAK